MDSKTSSKYQQMEHLQHIKELPDTYVGSSIKEEKELFIYDEGKIVKKVVTWVPAVYKIFDEIIVNAIDNHTRTKREKEKFPKKMIRVMDKLEVNIDKETGVISVLNTGEGIEVKQIDTEKQKDIYVIELIFGELLTSENFKDGKEKKVTGGKNGYGAKLTNIFSEEFTVESVDRKQKLLYKQTWTNNMENKDTPEITNFNGEPYTKISFKPDYKRFGLEGMSDDLYSIFSKRVYDCALWFSGNMKIELDTKIKDVKVPMSVYLNNEEIVCSLNNYISYYTNGEIEEKDVIIEKMDRWEIGIILSKNHKYMQTSMVNGITTIRGGKHVDNVINQIVKRLGEAVLKKKKKVEIKSSYVKDNIWIFIKCIIEEPTFDGQTKESMTTNISNFGSKCEISEKFIDKLIKIGLLERIYTTIDLENSRLGKKTDGTKQASIRGIKKLDDANFAGTKLSDKCTLILTEGDSAKATAISGLSVVGRDYYGVFPLKGKLLNVRDITEKKMYENEEINNIKKIIGLEADKEYDDFKSLRYGKIMIMTDQDHDGFHIKGLLINLFHSKWYSLYKNGFITCMVTPIVKASKGSKELQFYNLIDYNTWKEENNESGWKVKYYKGLGTSNRKEAQEYFKNLKTISYFEDEKSNDAVIKAFSKDKANARKNWLKYHNKDKVLNIVDGDNKVSYSEFVDNELIHFSNSDNLRSIPDIIDGLKPSQRKVLFSAFKKKLKNDIKVSQFCGYISEQTSYHHGEASLQMTVINMAQNYPGSNNIELLVPSGQFGTRIANGKDASSPRYIFTRLAQFTTHLYNEQDGDNLEYLNDDGFSIEPKRYYPTIPMVLINGARGIGTGWSTDIPQYNPLDIISLLDKKMKGESIDDEELVPWYRDYLGSFHKTTDKSFINKGVYEIINNNTIRILELPIGVSLDEYKEFLDKAVSGKDPKIDWIENYENYSTDTNACFIILCKNKQLKQFVLDEVPDEFGCNKIHKELKLVKPMSLNNMVLYNKDHVLTRYNSPIEIINEFYTTRLIYYTKRKVSLLKKYNHRKDILENKIRFLQEQIDDILVLYKKKKDIVIKELENSNYMKISSREDSDPDYEYLLSMRMDSVTEEKLNKLKDELNDISNKINVLDSKTNINLWTEDLGELKETYSDYYSKIEKSEDLSKIKISSTLKTKATKKNNLSSKGTGRGRGKGSSGRGKK